MSKQLPDPSYHDRFAAAMSALGLDAPKQRIAVGVSGGGDSLALALLLKHWAEARGGEVLALTVDHGLRAGSAAEAASAGKLLARHGIRHKILDWQGQKPLTHIQERARLARYGLLQAACRAENIPLLAVAHNAEDQIETFWMRLAKGSGLDGLTAMAPRRALGAGLVLLRPLLAFTRAELRQVCSGFGVDWLEDPSNAGEQFLRVKLRQFESLLAEEGLTPQRLSLVLHKLGAARDALQGAVEGLLQQAAQFHDAGYAVLGRGAWLSAPAELQRRSLAHLLQTVAPQPYGAGFEALEAARAEMAAAEFKGRTLHGCEIFAKRDAFLISREAHTAAPPGLIAEGMVWDGRFQVSGYRESLGRLSVRYLGDAGVATLRKKLAKASPELRRFEDLPSKVKKTVPGIWKGENLVCIPSLTWVDAGADAKLKKLYLRFLKPGDAGADIAADDGSDG
jgi:tRNA(Ile)-lysidine synthase